MKVALKDILREGTILLVFLILEIQAVPSLQLQGQLGELAD